MPYGLRLFPQCDFHRCRGGSPKGCSQHLLDPRISVVGLRRIFLVALLWRWWTVNWFSSAWRPSFCLREPLPEVCKLGWAPSSLAHVWCSISRVLRPHFFLGALPHIHIGSAQLELNLQVWRVRRLVHSDPLGSARFQKFPASQWLFWSLQGKLSLRALCPHIHLGSDFRRAKSLSLNRHVRIPKICTILSQRLLLLIRLHYLKL